MQSINLKIWNLIKAFIGIFRLIVTCDFNVYQLTELVSSFVSIYQTKSSIAQFSNWRICLFVVNIRTWIYWLCHGLYFCKFYQHYYFHALQLMWTSSLPHIRSNIFLFVRSNNQKERKRINFSRWDVQRGKIMKKHC